jgi:hypothetical protein
VSIDQTGLADRVRVTEEHLRALREDLESIPTGSAADVREVEWLRGLALSLVDDLERAQAALGPLATSLGLQVHREETLHNYLGTPGRTVQQTRWFDITPNNPAANYFNSTAGAKREALRSRTLSRDASRFVSPSATRAS